MPTFSFVARSAARSVRGLRNVESEDVLARDLAADGLFLLRAEAVAPARAATAGARMKPRERATFLLHLVSYLEAGLPLLSGLRDFRDPEHPRLEAAALDMGARLAEGASFSETMEAFPGLFPPLQVAMVRAGEAMGRLNKALRAVIKLNDWDLAFRAQVRRATLYPLILLALITGTVMLASAVSLPSILQLLEEFHIPLPWFTKAFIWMGHGLSRHGWVLAAVPFGLWLALSEALRRPSFRLHWDTVLLSVPFAGRLAQRMALSRFAHFFAEQYGAGLSLVTALRNCEEVTGNARLGLCVRTIRLGVEQGGRLADLAAQTGYFPPLVIRMLALGETTGNMEEALEKTARHFDAEVAERVNLVFLILDPLVKVILGALLVFVGCAVLLPLYTLAGAIND